MAQAYTKLGWTSGAPPQINGPNLDKMDQGILLASAPLVTQLPANPVDGQECNFLADAANGVLWHLVYRAADGGGAQGTSKWLYTGGQPMASWVDAYEGHPGDGAYHALATAGPIVTVPVLGDYLIEFGCTTYNTVSDTIDAMQIGVGVVAASTGHEVSLRSGPAQNTNRVSLANTRKLTNVPAGSALTAMYWANGATANSGQFGYRWLTARPVRVG